MGNWWSEREDCGGSPPAPGSAALPGLEGQSHRKRPRPQEEVGDEEVEELSPRRKRIQTTSTYIYETLFKKGVNSDITITALGKEWKLHKIYLCQSGYFSSMFSGNWKESKLSSISLDIPDPNITTEALDLAFSSLYRDGVPLEQLQIFSTVATASMLQMEGLLQHCKEFMRETLNPGCVVHYLTASSLYGMHDIEEDCRMWLKLNLLKNYDVALLRDLNTELLTELLKSPDLYVMQVEMDVYTLAKRWLFLSLNPEWSGEFNQLTADSDKYFKNEGNEAENRQYFLETDRGQPYIEVFRAIRIPHILNDVVSVHTLESDRIIPKGWLLPMYRDQWLKMLSVDQRIDVGPSGMTLEQFNALSFRCGRVLYDPGDYCWRWTGFSFGFDILILYDSNSGLISVKRNTRTQPCVSAVSLQAKRMLSIRLRVTSYGGHGELCSHQDTGVIHLSLSQDEDYSLTTVSSSAKFPLYISVSMALTSPDDDPYQTHESVDF